MAEITAKTDNGFKLALPGLRMKQFTVTAQAATVELTHGETALGAPTWVYATPTSDNAANTFAIKDLDSNSDGSEIQISFNDTETYVVHIWWTAAGSGGITTS